MTVNKINKVAMLTDIHFGKKSNSVIHNSDCLNFVKWFCNNVKNDKTIEAVCFLGDWHENRSHLNISTLTYSYKAAKLLNDLDLPVYFIIGNHDLYHRFSRDVYSVLPFKEFDNFTLITEVTEVPELGEKGSLICPFLFDQEYAELNEYQNIPVWFGHFEFKDFIITGYNIKMENGPEADVFDKPARIFSGHFHKRQSQGNVHYIGNTFPMSYSDAGDHERGMCTYQFDTDDLVYTNWTDGPRYIKTRLSTLMKKGGAKNTLVDNAYVKCLVDEEINYEEGLMLQDSLVEKFSLRDFTFEESGELTTVLEESDTEVDETSMSSVDDLVRQMLGDIKHKQIDSKSLIKIYEDLRVD
jgi:DNA repair exonuclease SbcCD nuclease subunit